MALLSGPRPPLTPLIEIGDAVPDEAEGIVFRNVGEGLSFDGRFVAFWATWGTDTRTVILQCPDEGNRERLEYCRSQHPDGYAARVPVHQGIFVHDIETGQTTPIAKTPDDFTDFVYWNFSGKVPGSHGEEEGEPRGGGRPASRRFPAWRTARWPIPSSTRSSRPGRVRRPTRSRQWTVSTSGREAGSRRSPWS